jgi:hypothetical protein
LPEKEVWQFSFLVFSPLNLPLNIFCFSICNFIFIWGKTQDLTPISFFAVYHNQSKIGYVNKVFCKLFRQLLPSSKVSATIAKKNGTAERPLLDLLLSVDSSRL